MPPVSLDDVKITSNGNTVTIGDSVKIVVSGTGQSPTKVKISRSPTPTNTTQDSKTLALSEQRERSKSPVPKRTEATNDKKRTKEEVQAESRRNAEKMALARSKSRSSLAGSKQDLRSEGTVSKKGNVASLDDLKKTLAVNPGLVEKFIIESVSLETLEGWVRKKSDMLNLPCRLAKVGKHKLSDWKYSVNTDKTNMLDDMTKHLMSRSNNHAHLLYDLAHCIAAAIDADHANVYVHDKEGQVTRFLPFDHEKREKSQQIRSGTTVAAHCAKVKDIIKSNNVNMDPRFPHGVPGHDPNSRVLCFPICSDMEDIEVVLEFIREGRGVGYTENEIEVVNSYLVWGAVGIHFSVQYSKIHHQKFVNEFLLSVVKSIFQEMVSMDTLILQIMNQAQKLVNADRASLFLVDSKTRQLYARIFDVSGGVIAPVKQAPQDVRFPVGTGIAGYVAETGETLNVQNVYADDRFNKGIDEQTGYTTRSILCMPICIRGAVIGVVQMINKKTADGIFTRQDEESFKTFAVYCGLALHHAKLYDKIRRSEQKYKVALEVLSYHNAASLEEVEIICNEERPTLEENRELATFDYFGVSTDDMTKVRQSLFMFGDLFGTEKFDYNTLARFFITVKKNYRSVAYHNWSHGFHVANSIYCILKHCPGKFSMLESLAMFIGALCHDLDHRGFNNKFMIDIGSPLAAIYSTSTMEHHHFNMTIIILQQENHNIFSKLSPDEYKQVLGNMKHCILATDLALFFPNKARLSSIVETDSFNWANPEHRSLVQTMMMTGSDLCSSTKPWSLQLVTLDDIYEEFFAQGDKEMDSGRLPVPIMNRFCKDDQAIHQGDMEKSLGWTPIPINDRQYDQELAAMQVGFFSGICLPCYELMTKIVPSVSPMLENCADNLASWKKLAEQNRKEIEN